MVVKPLNVTISKSKLNKGNNLFNNFISLFKKTSQDNNNNTFYLMVPFMTPKDTLHNKVEKKQCKHNLIQSGNKIK